MLAILALAAALCRSAAADSITLTPVPDGGGPATAIYHLSGPATGGGTLWAAWTDAYGREVDRFDFPFRLDAGSTIAFPLDLRRAVAMSNKLRAHVVFDGPGDHREAEAALAFAAPAPDRGWQDYRAIVWQTLTPAQYGTLRGWGVTAGKVFGNRDDAGPALDPAQIAPLLDADLRWYVENIATDFYSAYHRWFPDRPVNWRFLEVQKRYGGNPDNPTAFVRVPSLSDPEWLARIGDRLGRTVRAHASYTPLYYSLGDEPGIADLAAFWDFDFSAPSLQGFRAWLAVQYGSLVALNAEWGSDFGRWDQVVPMTTREAMRRTDANFSAWADFKAWMDVAFARALRAGTDAVHGADPAAYSAIEGGQIPGWGGYDYSRLADAVDLMELYDYDDNVAIVRSLNPRIILLTTVSAEEEGAASLTWRALLRGGRGIILWDPGNRLARPDGSPGDAGRRLAPTLRALTGGLGTLLANSTLQNDPIAILYSPESFRTRWMLEHQPAGEAWSRRDAEAEYREDGVRAAAAADRRALAKLGLQYRYVSSAGLKRGELRGSGIRALMLPGAIALSAAAAAEIRSFVAGGGLAIADVEPGQFDQHGRRQPSPSLADLFGSGKAVLLPLDRTDRDRQIARLLDDAGVRSGVTVADATGRPEPDIELYVLRNGEATIVGLVGGAADETLLLTLPGPRFAYDVLRGRALGCNLPISVTTNADGVALVAASSAPLGAPTVVAPATARAGDTVEIEIRVPAALPTARRILRADVVDPAGRIVPYYSRNLLAPGGAASFLLPLALNDPLGLWQIRITDVLSGQQATAEIRASERERSPD